MKISHQYVDITAPDAEVSHVMTVNPIEKWYTLGLNQFVENAHSKFIRVPLLDYETADKKAHLVEFTSSLIGHVLENMGHLSIAEIRILIGDPVYEFDSVFFFKLGIAVKVDRCL